MTALTHNTQASTSLSHNTNSYHCKCNYIRAITHATQLEVHINSDTQNNWKCTSTQTLLTTVQLSYHHQYNNSCQSTTEKKRDEFTYAHSLSMRVPNFLFGVKRKHIIKTHRSWCPSDPALFDPACDLEDSQAAGRLCLNTGKCKDNSD